MKYAGLRDCKSISNVRGLVLHFLNQGIMTSGKWYAILVNRTKVIVPVLPSLMAALVMIILLMHSTRSSKL